MTAPFLPRIPGEPAWWCRPMTAEELAAYLRRKRAAEQRQREQEMWEAAVRAKG